MRKFLLVSILFVLLISCGKDDNDYLIQELIRLEREVMETEIERDLYKAQLYKIIPQQYVLLPDTSQKDVLSIESIKTYSMYYPN